MNRNRALRNILISVATADAIGADIEFMPHPTQQDFLREVSGHSPLRVTDDTQMSLFTAEALLRGYRKSEFRTAYLHWYRTQVAQAPPSYETGYTLVNEPVLYSQRAPGNTCMQSLRELRRYKSRMRNDSKGNGTVMRCFPLVPFITPDNIDDLVFDCVYTTHDHLYAFWSTKLAVLIGKGLSEGMALEFLLSLYQKYIRMLGMKIELSEYQSAEQIGGGWIAEEALMIALWALQQGKGNWMRTVELATIHPGDSDTTGAIVGGFLGCQGIIPPDSLQQRVDVYSVIHRLLAAYPQEEEKTV